MKLKFILLFFSIIITVLSQEISLKGYIYDSQTNRPIATANIYSENGKGTSSDINGFYRIVNLQPNERITISHIGYNSVNYVYKGEVGETENFYLSPATTMLDETIVQSSRVNFRETPISFSEIDPSEIGKSLGSRESMHILNKLPNVYSSPQGGGFGELRLNIRGFDQTNIGVMLNGVPLNNPENGEVYWSNYAGISDVIGNIQVQRGLGASPYSTGSVGGLVNIVTTGFSTGATGTKIKLETGSNQFRKYTASIKKPIGNNFSITALFSEKTWDGYADQTELKEFTYYLSLGSVLDNHSLLLQLIGSPQTHDQRITPSLLEDYEKYGTNYNPDWGYLNGEPLSIRDNKFHKPSFNLVHNWVLNDAWNLSSVLYYTNGVGGGTVPPWTTFGRTANGLIDFQKEWNYNSNNIDSTFHPTLNRSQNPLRDVVHKHNWLGGVSSANFRNGNLKLSFGLDGKYYAAQNYAKVGNLLGGDYYIGFANKNRNPNTLLTIGDKIDYDADSFARQLGGFIQLEISPKNFDAFINLSVSNTSYKRRDKFNYSSGEGKYETDWESFTNFSVKTGFSYKINYTHSIYFNIGYFTKAPIAFNVFDYSNNKYENITNEKIFNTEVGYRFIADNYLLNINAYFTTWKDQAISRTIQDENTGQYFFYNIAGASARHFGFESDFKIKLDDNLWLDGMASYAVNKWTNNVNTTIAPESNPTQSEQINAYVDELYVGNSPMTRAYLALDYTMKLSDNLDILLSPAIYYYDRLYADYDPANRTDPLEDEINSWRLPDFHTIDFHTKIGWKLNSNLAQRISIGFHIFNLLDDNNIVYALDGITHDSKSARVFYGRNRTWSVDLTFHM